MLPELAAKEVSGNIDAIYPGDSSQARNARITPANHVEALPEKLHEVCLAQAEHLYVGDHAVYETGLHWMGEAANEEVIVRDKLVTRIETTDDVEEPTSRERGRVTDIVPRKILQGHLAAHHRRSLSVGKQLLAVHKVCTHPLAHEHRQRIGRTQPVVGVCKDHVGFRIRDKGNSLVHRVVQTSIGLAHPVVDLIIEPPNDVQSSVSRSSIDDEILQIRVGLAQHRVDCRLDSGRAVPYNGDYRDEWKRRIVLSGEIARRRAAYPTSPFNHP